MCCLIYKFLLILTQKMQISFLKILPENALKFVSKKMRICVKNFAQLHEEYMPTDVQFKYELRKHLTELERKLELLRNEEYEKLEKEYLKEIQDIQTSLED